MSSKISGLPSADSAALTQLVEIVNDPSGTPASQKLTLAQVVALLSQPAVIETVLSQLAPAVSVKTGVNIMGVLDDCLYNGGTHFNLINAVTIGHPEEGGDMLAFGTTQAPGVGDLVLMALDGGGTAWRAVWCLVVTGANNAGAGILTLADISAASVRAQGDVVAQGSISNSVFMADGGNTEIGFFGATPVVQPVLATGAGASIDDIILVLQNYGLVRQE